MDLSILKQTEAKSYITLKGNKQNQFNNEVVTVQCAVNDVLRFLDIDVTVQRELDDQKVASIGKYIQYGLEGNDIYFSPLIFSARGVGRYNERTKEYNIGLDDNLFILDGQHRIKAFELLKKRMEISNGLETMYKDLLNFPITIQVFLDLDKNQERQLFTDINTKSSQVNSTLLVMYSEGDLIGSIVKDISNGFPNDLIETRSRNTRSKLMTASTLYLIIKALNEGGYTKESKTYITEKNYDTYKRNTEKFITYLIKYAPIDAFDRDKYIIFGSNVLIGIAKFVYEAKKLNSKDSTEDLFKKVIAPVNWQHKNDEFKKINIQFNRNTKKYNLGATGRTVRDISKFLLKKYDSN